MALPEKIVSAEAVVGSVVLMLPVTFQALVPQTISGALRGELTATSTRALAYPETVTLPDIPGKICMKKVRKVSRVCVRAPTALAGTRSWQLPTTAHAEALYGHPVQIRAVTP